MRRFLIFVLIVWMGGALGGCGKDSSGKDGVAETIPAEERGRTARFEVGEAWGFPGYLVTRSVALGMVLGVRPNSESGLEVYPIQVDVDTAGYSDAVADEDTLVLVGKRVFGRSSVSAFQSQGEWLLWTDRHGADVTGEAVISSSGTRISVASDNGMKVFDRTSGEVLREVKADRAVFRKVKGMARERVFYLPSGLESDGQVLDAGTLQIRETALTDITELFWRGDQLVSLYAGVMYDALSGEELMVLEGALDVTTVSADGRYALTLSEDWRILRVLDVRAGRQVLEVVGQGMGSIRAGYRVWGDALAILNGDRYKVFDLGDPERIMQFWPVWDVEPDGFAWYLESEDGRWAGSSEAAEARGMTGEADFGLVEEFGELVGL